MKKGVRKKMSAAQQIGEAITSLMDFQKKSDEAA